MDDFWRVEEAEQRFGEVVHQALTNVPQTVITPDGRAVVIMDEREHDRLVLAWRRLVALGETPPEPSTRAAGTPSFWEFIQGLPPVEELRAMGLPDDALARVLEEDREREYRALRAGAGSSASAAD